MHRPVYTGRLRTRRLLCISIPARSSSKILALAKVGLANRRRSLSSLFVRTSFDPLAKVLYSLSEHEVGQEIVEVPLEVAGSLFPELCVHPDVGLHPGALTEAEGPVSLRETHAQRQVKLQDAVVEHVTFLVAEVKDQLLNLGRRHP